MPFPRWCPNVCVGCRRSHRKSSEVDPAQSAHRRRLSTNGHQRGRSRLSNWSADKSRRRHQVSPESTATLLSTAYRRLDVTVIVLLLTVVSETVNHKLELHIESDVQLSLSCLLTTTTIIIIIIIVIVTEYLVSHLQRAGPIRHYIRIQCHYIVDEELKAILKKMSFENAFKSRSIGEGANSFW